jgi:hypothetical protein
MASENVYGAYRPADILGSIETGQKMAGEQQRMSDLARQRKKQEGYESTLAKNVGPDGKLNKTVLSDLAGQGYGKEAFELGGVIEEQEAKAMKNKQDAHVRRVSMVGNALDGLAGMNPQERAANYPKVRSQLVQSGLISEADAPEQYDDGYFRTAHGQFQQTREYLEKQGIVLGQQKTREDMANDKRRIALDESKIAQADRHKVADITGNARLAEKRGQQQIAAIDAQGKNALAIEEARGGQSRLTKGTVSGDKAAEIGANKDPYAVSTEYKMKKLNGTDKARLDNVRMAHGAITSMASALSNGDNTFSLIGDNDFTMAERNFSEALGRMQSGGAITPKEASHFAAMAPKMMDSPAIKQKKLENLVNEMGARFNTLGFEPSEFGLSTEVAQVGKGVPEYAGGVKSANAKEPAKMPDFDNMSVEELMKFNGGKQ